MKVTTNYIYCIWNNQYLHTLCAAVWLCELHSLGNDICSLIVLA